jgi:hypothetical protein
MSSKRKFLGAAILAIGLLFFIFLQFDSGDTRLSQIVGSLKNHDSRLENWQEYTDQKRIEADCQVNNRNYHLLYEDRSSPPAIPSMLLVTYKDEGSKKRCAIRYDGPSGKVVLGEVTNPEPGDPTARFEAFPHSTVMNGQLCDFWQTESETNLNTLSEALR